MSEEAIRFERRGALAVVTLNRPKALNALTLDMIRPFDRHLAEWQEDAEVAAVVVKGEGDRAFCAGGDIRAIREAALGDRDKAAAFFAGEYRLNRRIFHFPKPYIALLDGITMGGGVGISAHGSHRVTTEKTLFAMPETGIGLFPDVGATHLLGRLPGELGLYLGLTGYRMKAADCHYVGVASDHVASADLEALEDALAAADWADDGEATASAVLAGRAAEPGEPPLAEHREAIDRCFAESSVEGIVAALEAEGSDWAAKTLEALGRCSPTSLKITLKAIREGARLDFDSAMSMEYRLSQHCVAGHDLPEGIRAVLIDKDMNPRWKPARLEEVDEALVDEHFGPLKGPDLTFD